MTGVRFEELIFLSGKKQLNVSIPLLTQLTSGCEVVIGRALTQHITWNNHVYDVRCYSGFTVADFLVYCIQSLKLSGNADCYSLQRKNGTEFQLSTPIPFDGFKEEIILVNRNAIKKPVNPPAYKPKFENSVSGIAGCPPVFTIQIGIQGVYNNFVVKRDELVETMLRRYLQRFQKNDFSEDLFLHTIVKCNDRVLNRNLMLSQCGVVGKKLDCFSCIYY